MLERCVTIRRHGVGSLLCVALLLAQCFSIYAIHVRRRDADARPELRIPLEYDAASNLYTASIRVGTPARTLRTLVDTGSAFLLLQRSAAEPETDTGPSSTTRRTFPPKADAEGAIGQRQKVDIKGKFTFTNADGSGQSASTSVADMHFYTDVFGFDAAQGEGGGAEMMRDVVYGSTTLGDLKGLDGILGLAPPFSKVTPAPTFSKKPPMVGTRKKRRSDGSTPPPSAADPGADTPSNLDVSFLHSFLGEAIPPYSGFYVALNSSNTTPGAGQLVFPASDTLPANIAGYDMASYFQADPSTGCTFPKHAFWGIAHRPDLRFSLSGDGVAAPDGDDADNDVIVDAVLLDSGTSGILGPRSEVDKITARLGAKVLRQVRGGSGQGDQVVSTRVECGSAPIDMAFEFAGRRFSFPSIRPSPASQVANGEQGREMSEVQAQPDNPGLTDLDSGEIMGADGVAIGRWKSYADIDGAVQAYRNMVGQIHPAVDGYVTRLSSALGISAGSNSDMMQKRNRRISPRLQARQSSSFIDPSADDMATCSLTVVGSEAVEHMFPRPAGATQDLKVWILGQEFFQHNLVYHNIEHATITILPKISAQ